MADLKDLAPVELEIMDVLWEKGEASVKDVQKALKKSAYNTVATMLNRLKDKGYVEAEEKDFRYAYRPLVPRENVVRRKLEDFMNRVLHGNLEPLAAYITEQRDLTPEQLDALEEIIKAKKRKGK